MDNEGSLQCRGLIILRLRVQVQVDLDGKQFLNLSRLFGCSKNPEEGRRKQQHVDVTFFIRKSQKKRGACITVRQKQRKTQYIMYMCSL